jgi:putative heme-binding domain-containing protein
MRPACAALLLLAAGLLGTAPPLSAQHATAFDVEDGGRAFRNSCATCHGPDGDQVAGIDLGRGQFRRAYSDEELVGIIRKGIPNTPMPPTNMSEVQAGKIVAYLRSTAESRRSSTAVAGDAVRGQSIFQGRGECATCHRVHGVGSRLGPDLTAIGQARRSVELEQALLEPAADILASNRFYRIVTRGGETVTGRLLNHDTFTVQLLDSTERLRSFVKADLREHGFLGTPMPSYRGRLSPQEVADVVSYLASLKGRRAQ